MKILFLLLALALRCVAADVPVLNFSLSGSTATVTFCAEWYPGSVLQSSSDMVEWTSVGPLTLAGDIVTYSQPADAERRFFRLQVNNSVRLAWDPNPEPDIAGYILYYGLFSGDYASANTIDAQLATTCKATGLVGGVTYYFVVTAYNTSGLESDYSNEVSYTPPPHNL